MPDLFQLVRSIDTGCLIELRVDAGNGRQVDDGTPAEALPDIGDDVDCPETVRIRDQASLMSRDGIDNLCDKTIGLLVNTSIKLAITTVVIKWGR